jgi:cold shock CspA family protein
MVGKKVETTEKVIKPSRRGSLLRFCRGEVLSMLNSYGWLMLYGDIDDPATEKHGGDVYIHKDDIVEGETICPGDIVSFYLYSDDKGLGAEMCTVEQKASSRPSMNAAAKELVPAGSVPEIINVDKVADVYLRLCQAFSDSEDEVSDSDGEYYSFEPSKAKRAPSSEGSTHGSDASDSEEEETSCEEFSDSETESSSQVQWRAPPGLSLPSVEVSAPPGLLPPGLEKLEGYFSHHHWC